MISWILSNWMTIAMVALSVVGGASVIVKAIAPLTKSTFDDRLVKILDWIHKSLSRVALNPKNTSTP